MVCLIASSQAWAAAPTKKILILFPLESNSPGFVQFDQALRSALNESQAYRFDFYVECMDLLRFPGERYLRDLVQIYREKYSTRNIDLIIAPLRLSHDFLAQYAGELFPGTPVLAIDLDTRLIDAHTLQRSSAVVTGKFAMENTLDLALGLHPKVREVFVVSGASRVDRDVATLVQNAFRGYTERVQFHYLSELSMEETLRGVAALPAHSIIYYVSFFQDADGQAFLPNQAVAMISATASVPVYGLSESYIGAGAVGGRVYSYVRLGAKTAQAALGILSGEANGAVGPLEEPADQVIFDWHQFKRWGIREADLPAGSMVRYRDFSPWQAYRFQILGIASVLILQTLIIGALVFNLKKRRQAEAEAHRRMTELAHVTRVATIGELAASLAHEINQPLTAILSNAQAAQRFLSSSAPDLDEIRQILDDIVRDDDRVSEVIRRMRALLKKQTDSYESFDLDQAVRECITLVHDSAPLDGLSIRADLNTNLPVVRADRVQLQQVLFNLMVNAVAAMSEAPGTARKMLITTAMEDPRTVKVSVTDSGTGIDELQVDRLFEPFYTTKPSGMGMGLAISQTIVKAHGGKMGALNHPEGGATFYFTLPIVREGRP
ncbi:MAG: hypothetical protein AUK55_16150 [Syntrophobacteraceae bacterium CG2_30_61_12]|nr:MAG: hypothetical protein AUK55_16150 [Syntrophobacteraceae bacterium CG2_30_61_12]